MLFLQDINQYVVYKKPRHRNKYNKLLQSPEKTDKYRFRIFFLKQRKITIAIVLNVLFRKNSNT